MRCQSFESGVAALAWKRVFCLWPSKLKWLEEVVVSDCNLFEIQLIRSQSQDLVAVVITGMIWAFELLKWI